jgi:hypothetical protein
MNSKILLKTYSKSAFWLAKQNWIIAFIVQEIEKEDSFESVLIKWCSVYYLIKLDTNQLLKNWDRQFMKNESLCQSFRSISHF